MGQGLAPFAARADGPCGSCLFSRSGSSSSPERSPLQETLDSRAGILRARGFNSRGDSRTIAECGDSAIPGGIPRDEVTEWLLLHSCNAAGPEPTFSGIVQPLEPYRSALRAGRQRPGVPRTGTLWDDHFRKPLHEGTGPLLCRALAPDPGVRISLQ